MSNLNNICSPKLVLCVGVTIGLFVTFAVAAVGVVYRSDIHLGNIDSLSVHQNPSDNIGTRDVVNIDSLRLVQVIFRHGDRTPLYRFPKNPYDSREYWPEGWGQLSTRGKQQQFILGQYFRNRYDGYLNKTYVPEEIYAQSSSIDRAIQSAMANLAGMWPPTSDDPLLPQSQYVPVHTIPAAFDNKIAFTRSCPKYETLMNAGPLRPSERAFEEENKHFYDFLSENSGLNITNYFNVSNFYDTVLVHTLRNFTLPKWVQPLFPDKLLAFAEKEIQTGIAYTDEMLRLRAGPLLTDIVRNMQRVVDQPTPEQLKLLKMQYDTPASKFYMYSGHDTTIAPTLMALGAFDGKYPPYCSSLVFELHQNGPQNSTDYHVKILYHRGLTNPPVEISAAKCTRKPCPYQEFLESVEPFILNERQWEQECQS